MIYEGFKRLTTEGRIIYCTRFSNPIGEGYPFRIYTTGKGERFPIPADFLIDAVVKYNKSDELWKFVEYSDESMADIEREAKTIIFTNKNPYCGNIVNNRNIFTANGINSGRAFNNPESWPLLAGTCIDLCIDLEDGYITRFCFHIMDRPYVYKPDKEGWFAAPTDFIMSEDSRFLYDHMPLYEDKYCRLTHIKYSEYSRIIDEKKGLQQSRDNWDGIKFIKNS